MSFLSQPPQHSPWRWSASVFLLANAAIHFYLAPMHLMEAPYIGVLFIALSSACIVLAVLLTFLDNGAVWAAAGALSLVATIAFLTSRTVGLPQLDDDIGNWTEPLGYLNLVVEILTITVALAALWSVRRALPQRVASQPRA